MGGPAGKYGAQAHALAENTGIHCRLDELLADRGLTLTRLGELVGVSVVNLSILKNNRAKAIRYSTLQAICAALDCEVGELLVHIR
ncbi:helix-turn-helix transcriptional regulator [Arthrobacter sp. TMP15]|uniref:helix-turn-helix domain-containing protein n=1 Tax=Arthrobacter sp. TMP15 TaxID=3140789 RepID=UPI0031BAE8DC